ncbi:hypothetical protein PCE1_003383 [Barthelona sp. PCE]
MSLRSRQNSDNTYADVNSDNESGLLDDKTQIDVTDSEIVSGEQLPSDNEGILRTSHRVQRNIPWYSRCLNAVGKLCGGLLVIFMLGVHYMGYKLGAIEICDKWAENSIVGYIIKYLWMFFTIFNLTSYLRAVFSGGGFVPFGWGISFFGSIYPISLDLPVPDHVYKVNGVSYRAPICIEQSSESRIRYCTKCCAWKPDRSHHCSVCNRCVMWYDHHCPYIAACVGAKNRKFFVQFLIYQTVVLIVSDIIFLYGIFDHVDVKNQMFASSAAFLFFTGVMTVVLIPFMVYHTLLVVKNMSSIEYGEWQAIPKDYRKDHQHTFDLGKGGNFRHVFGEKWYQWFIPTHHGTPFAKKNSSAGIIWPINPHLFDA